MYLKWVLGSWIVGHLTGVWKISWWCGGNPYSHTHTHTHWSWVPNRYKELFCVYVYFCLLCSSEQSVCSVNYRLLYQTGCFHFWYLNIDSFSILISPFSQPAPHLSNQGNLHAFCFLQDREYQVEQPPTPLFGLLVRKPHAGSTQYWNTINPQSILPFVAFSPRPCLSPSLSGKLCWC